MNRRTAWLPIALATLGCGGLFLDDAGLDALVGSVKDVSPDATLTLLTAGAAEVGLVNPLCGKCLQPVANADPSMRAVLVAHALFEATCACPSTCASEALSGGPVTMTEVGVACGGDDPVFQGPLAPLRASVLPLDYAVARMLVEALPEEDRSVLREPLALGLAASAGPFEPTPEAVVSGADTAVLTDRADALRACGTAVFERLVVRPDGTVAHHAGLGGCTGELLAKASFPPAADWRVVDLTWAAESIAKTAPPPAEGAEPPSPQ